MCKLKNFWNLTRAHLSDFQRTPIPVKSVVHGDSLLGIFGGLEDHGSRSLWPSIRTDVDVSANDVTGRSEEVLQVLPTSLVWQLEETSASVTVERSINHVRCRRIVGFQGCYLVGQSDHGGEAEGEVQRVTRDQPWPYRSFRGPELHRNGTRSLGPKVAVRKLESTGTQGGKTYLTNEDGTAEQNLFRQLAHRALGILLRRELNDTVGRLRSGLPRQDEQHSPTPLRNTSGSDKNFGE